jgi:hypothetical protein
VTWRHQVLKLVHDQRCGAHLYTRAKGGILLLAPPLPLQQSEQAPACTNVYRIPPGPLILLLHPLALEAVLARLALPGATLAQALLAVAAAGYILRGPRPLLL